MKSHRKGSMQLSIEAIIILVIAMVLLGFAIAFVSGLLKSGQGKLQTIIDQTEVSCMTNAETLISISPNAITLKPDESTTLTVCAYADKDYTTVDPISLAIDCANATPSIKLTDPTAGNKFITSTAVPMQRGTKAQFSVTFSGVTSAQVNALTNNPKVFRDICKIEIISKDSTTTPATITVLASRDVPIQVST